MEENSANPQPLRDQGTIADQQKHAAATRIVTHPARGRQTLSVVHRLRADRHAHCCKAEPYGTRIGGDKKYRTGKKFIFCLSIFLSFLIEVSRKRDSFPCTIDPGAKDRFVADELAAGAHLPPEFIFGIQQISNNNGSDTYISLVKTENQVLTRK